jgi:hypothetical protein
MLIYASNKYFGLVDVSQSRLEGSTRLGRKLEASSVVIPTIHGIPGCGLSIVSTWSVPFALSVDELFTNVHSCSSVLLLKLNIYVWPLWRSLNHPIISALYDSIRRVDSHLVCLTKLCIDRRTGLTLSAPLYRCPLLHRTHWTISRSPNNYFICNRQRKKVCTFISRMILVLKVGCS